MLVTWYYVNKTFIAERISARHWIADCGPGIGSCMYVCMYVCPSRFWNAIKAPRMRDGNSICCVHVCILYYMRCSLHTWIIIYVHSFLIGL